MVNYQNDLKEKRFSVFVCPRLERTSHTHDFLELVYVQKGEAVHIWDKNVIEIKSGDYFVIDYQSVHSYRSKSEEFEIINCLFMPEFIDASLVNCRSFQNVIRNYQIYFGDEVFSPGFSMNVYRDESKEIKNLLDSAIKEFETQAPGYLQVIRSKLIEILVLTMRKNYSEQKKSPITGGLGKIVEYINSEYMNNITLGTICRNFGYSFSYLSAKFKQETGSTFTGFLQKTRIEQSMRLLAHTDLSIDEIAQRVGYQDIKSFYAQFKKISDTTPAKFRKSVYLN